MPRSNPNSLAKFNEDAERAVIGSILIDPAALLDIQETGLTSDDFYSERWGHIFEAAQHLHTIGRRCDDLIAISDQLERRGLLKKVGGPAVLSELIDNTFSSRHARYYAAIVRRDGLLRRLMATGAEIVSLAHGSQDDDAAETIGQAEALLTKLQQSAGGAGRGAAMDTIIHTVLDEFERAVQSAEAGGTVGLATGLTDLDRLLLGGLKARRMYTLAGRPGMGKSALALQIAWRSAQAGRRVLYFSPEMSAVELTRRKLAGLAGVPADQIEAGLVTVDQLGRINQAAAQFDNDRLRIIDNSVLPVDQLRQITLAEWGRAGVDLIVIDYLQLMVTEKKSENRQAEVAAISRAIKTLAGQVNVPILALSQLNRSVDSRPDKHPVLSDLRDSGAIEQDSDVVMFLYRDDVYNPDTEFPNIAEVNVAKNRAGKTGAVSLYFKRELTTFDNVEIRRQPLEF